VSAHRDKSKQPLSVRVVQDWEKRISEQMLLIADLEGSGQRVNSKIIRRFSTNFAITGKQ
jgi:hypothetical protein